MAAPLGTEYFRYVIECIDAAYLRWLDLRGEFLTFLLHILMSLPQLQDHPTPDPKDHGGCGLSWAAGKEFVTCEVFVGLGYYGVIESDSRPRHRSLSVCISTARSPNKGFKTLMALNYQQFKWLTPLDHSSQVQAFRVHTILNPYKRPGTYLLLIAEHAI